MTPPCSTAPRAIEINGRWPSWPTSRSSTVGRSCASRAGKAPGATIRYPPPPIAVTARGRYDLYDGLAELNGWAPTIAIVTGRCVDGHAGIAMLADFVVATESAVFGTQGGSDRSVRDYAQSGDVDVVVGDEHEAITAARRYLGFYLTDHDPSTTADVDAEHIADIVPGQSAPAIRHAPNHHIIC